MYEDIKAQVAEVLKYSQDLDSVNIDKHMAAWERNKKRFIDAFGGNLIVEYPQKVRFYMDEKTKQRKVNELITTIAENYNNMPLAHFIEDNIKTFYENKVSCEAKKCPKGAKLVKSFKHFEDNPELLEHFQSLASQIIQEDKIEGTLCMSVHPLDFLSSSENTHKWRSCHALDGEYRCGNLSYMMDPSTIICYVRSEDNVRLSRFPETVKWNSKKWRVLMYVSDNANLVFAGRQYPFSTAAGLDTLKNFMMPYINDEDPFGFSPWISHMIEKFELSDGNMVELNEAHIAIRGRLRPITDYVVDAENARHYNDLLYSSIYTNPLYTVRDNCEWMPPLADRIYIGHPVPCITCGQEPVLQNDTMECNNCYQEHYDDSNTDYCSECGRIIFLDNEDYLYLGTGECVCAECAEDTFVCGYCGNAFMNRDLRYDNEVNKAFCYECYHEHVEKEECEE